MTKVPLFGTTIPGDSCIHRLDARVKLVIAVLMMVVSLSARDLVTLITVFCVSVTFIALSRLPFALVIKSVRPILFLIIFAFVLHVLTNHEGDVWRWWIFRVSKQGLIVGTVVALRLILLVVNSAIFLSLTTAPMQLADATERLLKPLKRLRFPVHEFTMMMSIALRFVPTLFAEASKIMKAQSSRGASYDAGGIVKKLRGFVSILVPLFIAAFRRADDLAVALEARCYSGEEGRTKRRSARLHPLDYVFLFVVLCLLALSIGGRFVFTSVFSGGLLF